MTPPPPRLSGFLAAEAPVAVILQRGPGRFARLIRWDLTGDSFERGQWLKGRIYEQKSDLSPDGRLFVYFALDYRPRRQDVPGSQWPNWKPRGTWTAISRPPYLTALALWEGFGTYGGGGLFKSNRNLGLDGGEDNKLSPPPTFKVSRLRGIFDLDLTDVATLRRLMSGWTELREDRSQRLIDFGFRFNLLNAIPGWEDAVRSVLLQPEFEKYRKRSDGIYARPFADALLVRMQTWNETNRVAHALIRKDGTLIRPLGNATWADVDLHGRLVYALDGAVWALHGNAQEDEPKLLADFKGEEFEPMEAPDWAKQWPML